MSQFFYIHPDNPQARLINQAVEIVRKGGVIADLPHSSAAGRPQLYPDVPRSVRAVNLRFCG